MTSPAPTPASAAMVRVMIAPRRHGDEERRRRATSSAPSHARRGRGTSRATTIASVTPMLIAATDVISAATVPSVPQPRRAAATDGQRGTGDEAEQVSRAGYA